MERPLTGCSGQACSVALIVFFATRSVAIALSMAVIALLQTFLTRRRVELLFAGEQMALYLSPLLRDGVAILGFIFIAASREISGIAVLMAVAVLAEFVALSFVVRKYTNTATRDPAEAGNTRNELVRAGVLTMVASVLLAVTPLIMRSLVLRLLGEADFAVYEVADRNAYVLMSVVVGGMSVEALRRWRLAVANGNEASVLRESIVSVWLMVGLVITYSAVIISPVGEFVLKLLLGSEVDIDRIQRLSPIIAASSAAYVGAHLVTRALVALRREPLASAMLAVGAVITIAVSLLGTVVVDSLNVAAFASTVGFGLTIVASLTVATRGAAAEP